MIILSYRIKNHSTILSPYYTPRSTTLLSFAILYYRRMDNFVLFIEREIYIELGTREQSPIDLVDQNTPSLAATMLPLYSW